jgi:hypothetical protein
LPVHTSPSQQPASAELEQSPPLATQHSGGGAPVVPEVVVPLVPAVVVPVVLPAVLVPVVVVVDPVLPVVVPVEVVDAPVVPLEVVVPPSAIGGVLEQAARRDPNADAAMSDFQES